MTTTTTSTKKRSNRNPVKQVFITFPKSTVDKITFRDIFLKFTPVYYKVVEEKHKDGTPHLHAVIKFKDKFSCSHILKHCKAHFPDDWKRIDIKPVRSIRHALDYLSKEDTSPCTSGEYKETRGQDLWAIQKKKNFMKLLHETEEVVPGFINKYIIRDYHEKYGIVTHNMTLSEMFDYGQTHRMVYPYQYEPQPYDWETEDAKKAKAKDDMTKK